MFTGIITHLGKLAEREGATYTFKTDELFCKRLKSGTSVAVNGVCLTVLSKPKNGTFSVTIMPETVKRTMFSYLRPHDEVNLELPASLESFFSGHIVQGHIDGVGKVQKIQKQKNSRLITIEVSRRMSNYIVEKGSIAVNGISLTVIAAEWTHFIVGIIPYTWKHTMMMHNVKVGDRVNVEVDILAKYVDKLLKSKNI